MPVLNLVIKNAYHDSVFLMALAGKARSLPGVEDVSCVMGTPENRTILDDAGLLEAQGRGAGPNDLVVAVRAGTDDNAAAALDHVREALASQTGRSTHRQDYAPRTLDAAVSVAGGANLALISVPGRYAPRETRKALERGLNVFLFSDNVSIQDEVQLKSIAASRNLLLMGPDCGTAIIDGIAIGFANVVRRGSVGIVAAAGTGLQEVACLLDASRCGVSQAIGTGGRDLKQEVGGITTLQGIARLAEDPDTRVLCVVSKPPDPAVADRVVAALQACGKPAVACFVGAPPREPNGAVAFVSDLTAAARAAAALACGEDPASASGVDAELVALAESVVARLPGRRQHVRGLYSGGTLCYEALHILSRHLGEVWSNTPLPRGKRLKDARTSFRNTVVDLGDDEFTVGRPHPMIDHRLRNERLVREARNEDVGVILLDVVLGHGAHPNPAGAMAASVREAVAAGPAVVASITGTRADPQGYDLQKRTLQDLGVTVLPSNTKAALFAALVANRGRLEPGE
jgi:succinyl-CoA synthetase alpha subunit